MKESIKKSLAAEPRVLVRNLFIFAIIASAMVWSSSTMICKGFSAKGIESAKSLFTGG